MKRLHLLFSAMLAFAILKADNSINEYDKQFFIDTYASLAIDEMAFSSIPASITLAQAILESGWGRGKVAEGANNYFCIKCNNGWEGKTFDAKDDDPGLSCFRKYETVHESFRDHSIFLRDGRRYQPLFELEKTDFRGWAKGLKKCGYATAGNYADKLIELVEAHGLWIYDFAISTQQFAVIDTPEIPSETDAGPTHTEGEIMTEFPEPQPNPNKVADEPILALPLFQYDLQESQATAATDEQLTTRPTKKENVRKVKIRPIIPLPVADFERAD
ncbi:MAG: glucosaminidase domain-containing protein [Bacteroidota bacterium]